MANMRHATEADLAAIVAIYNSTVPTRRSTADTQEVSVGSILPTDAPYWYTRSETG